MNGEKYYKILGLSSNASDAMVRQKYRSLVKKYHPDKNKESDTTAQFIAIQEAYEKILKKDFTQKAIKNPKKEKSPEQNFHDLARKREARLREKEKADLKIFYASFKKGWRINVVRIHAIIGLICIVALIFDNFLPLRKSDETVASYNSELSQSSSDNYVQNIKTRNGLSLWLNNYNVTKFYNYQHFTLYSTHIFHLAVKAEHKFKSETTFIPIHFTFYWMQWLIFPIFLLPLIILFYPKRDVFFVLGNYFSLFISSSIMWVFLVNDLKIIHLLSWGNY